MTVDTAPRPGSRAARMAKALSVHVLKDMAAEYGVCLRPVSLRRTDLGTGHTDIIDVPCGATREDKCPSCAKRAQRLRQTQIREGWHRADEPAPAPEPATDAERSLISRRALLEYARDAALRASDWAEVADIDAAIVDVENAITAEGLRGRIAPSHQPDEQDEAPKRVRSTRRRQDVADLPRQKIQRRTVGKVYTAPDGTEYRPSMWLTVTLDSYGKVRDDGTPVNPDTYDYRQAAWDAVHFPRLLDRFWQNLRRCVGWNVQYAGCVEPQRRLAPHAHFAIRGTIPRTVLKQVVAATYHQVWWPVIDAPIYGDEHLPIWDGQNWTDPTTGQPLTTWDEALETIDTNPDTEPAHVVRFGEQVKAEGVNPGTRDANRTIGYITKYVTKAAADCHHADTDRQREHLDRLWSVLRITPCTDRCSNWLLYGIQPKKANGKLKPGRCKGKVHQRATLGIGGRRILVSRDWSGKTLTDHRHDTRAWVRNLLGISDPHDQVDAVDPAGGTPAPVAWELARPDEPDVPPLQHRLMRAMSQRIQWRNAILAAKQRAAEDTAELSATGRPAIHGEERE